MQRYYFQFRAYETHTRWEDIPAFHADFEDQDAAEDYAVELADAFNNMEVRLTDNKELIGGKYFH